MTSAAQRRHHGGPASGRPSTSPRTAKRRRIWIASAAAAVAAVLLASALITQRGPAGDPAASPGGAAQTASQPGIQVSRAGGGNVGDEAPQFTAITATGDRFTLPAGKPTVVFFMAGWCASCFPESQALARIHGQYGDKIAILAVSPDPSDTLPAIRAFADQAGARYGFAHDSDGTLATALGVRALDTTVVAHATGRIVYRDGYPTDEATLRAALTKAGLA